MLDVFCSAKFPVRVREFVRRSSFQLQRLENEEEKDVWEEMFPCSEEGKEQFSSAVCVSCGAKSLVMK